jgi:hypothetical protein
MADACNCRARRYRMLFNVPSSMCHLHCAIFIVPSSLCHLHYAIIIMSWVISPLVVGGAAVLPIAFTGCVIDKVIFELVSSLARRVGSPWRPGLEIGAFRRVKQSAKQFKGKVRSGKPEVKSLMSKKAKALLAATFGWPEDVGKREFSGIRLSPATSFASTRLAATGIIT